MPTDSRQILVLFDNSCAMCRNLALFMQRILSSSIGFMPWQEFKISNQARTTFGDQVTDLSADQLRVVTADKQLLAGEDAWAYLIATFPGLQQLHWLAHSLGMQKIAVKVVKNSADVARRMCAWCRPW